MTRKKRKSTPINYAAISRSVTLAACKYKRNPEKFCKDIIYGDIEWPEIPEGDRLKELPETSDKLAKEQFVWLVEVTEYVLRQLERWIRERLTLELMYYYNKLDIPFTARLIAIGKHCEQVLDVLPAILPDFQQRFREMYKRLTQAASKADSTRLNNLEDSMTNFKLASENFHSTVITIHSKALTNVKAETASGGKAEKTKRPSKQALALATLKDHPDWTGEQIAEAVGVYRTTLYDWPDFKKAKELLKQGKNDVPRGSKNGRTGDIEAWDK